MSVPMVGKGGKPVGQRIALEDIEPIRTPRRPDGRCGRCRGFIATEKLINELISTCRNCGREATHDCGVITAVVSKGGPRL